MDFVIFSRHQGTTSAPAQAPVQYSFGFHQLRVQPKWLEQRVEISAIQDFPGAKIRKWGLSSASFSNLQPDHPIHFTLSKLKSHGKLRRFVGCPFLLGQTQILLTH